MIIKLTTPSGIFSSSKHILVETETIQSVEDDGDSRTVHTIRGKHEVIETVEQLEKLINGESKQPATSPDNPSA